jgi:hypothetical protein
MARDMDECPYCGEPIDPDAEFCRHCGNDAETGWNPDSDYESLELPGDDEEEEFGSPAPEVGGKSEPRRNRARTGSPGGRSSLDPAAQAERLLGPGVVILAWIAFVAMASPRFENPVLVLVPAAYLAVCIVALSRLAPKPGAKARNRR